MLKQLCVFVCVCALQALEQRKQALTELEEKTEQLAGDADDFATLAAKLANKNKARSR